MMPAVVEETPSPIQGRLRPTLRSPYTDGTATTYLSASDSDSPGKNPSRVARLFEAAGVPAADAADAAETLEAIESPIGSPVARRPSRSTRPPTLFADSEHSRG